MLLLLINGTNLTEDTVTKRSIMSMRTSYGYTKDEDWAQYLVDNDLTPKKYRKSNLLTPYTQQILLQQAQKENGVTVSDEEVEKALKDAQERGRCQGL